VCLHGACADADARIHAGVALTGLGHPIEREADVFAASFLMPEWLFGPRCLLPRPTLADLEALGDELGTSQWATARRFAELAAAPCALAECRDSIVKRAVRSAALRGEAVRGRAVEDGSLAAAVMRGERAPEGGRGVATGVWGTGARKMRGVEMVEDAVTVPEDPGVVLVWLWHAAN
jgi:hypothetical protein